MSVAESGGRQVKDSKPATAIEQRAGMTAFIFSPLAWVLVAVVLIAACLPLWLGGYALGIMAIAYFYGVYAMSWDLIFGYAGNINFGPTVQIGISAYTTGILINSGFPVWLGIVCGILMAIISGALMTFPALKLRGAYFGLMTLAAVLLLKHFVILFSDYTGGELGLILNDVLVVGAAANYWIALACLVGSGIVIFVYANSMAGLILEAIGQDPVEAQALGFNIVKHRFFAFCVGSAFSGLAGSLMALYMGIASIDTAIDLAIVVQIIIAVVLGGRRTIIGGALGAIVIIVAGEFLRPIGQLNEFVVALCALLLILFLPDGIFGHFHNKWRHR